MRAKLLIEDNETRYEIDSVVIDDPNKLKPFTSKIGWEILREIAKKPVYPAELARKLNLNEQVVYHYIRQLKNFDLIEITKSEEIKGAFARYYQLKNFCFSFLPYKEIETKNYRITVQNKNRFLDREIENYLKPIVNKRVLDAKIVIGSPDQHGKFKARARDGHFAAELAAFLGNITEEIKLPLVYADTMIKTLEEENSNLIIIGGPITNSLSYELNKFLPIKFKPSGGHWEIYSEISGKSYLDDSIGVIEKIHHPYFKNRTIMLFAGKRNSGTIASIVGFIKRTKEIIKPNLFNKKYCCKVIEGLDLNSDGFIDDIEVKE